MTPGIEISETKTGNPLISLIVPAFNVESYLSDCLDSILSQKYGNIEIILVDDGSTDNTGTIAHDYQNRYPKKIVCLHQNNAGVMKARLAGIEAAHGEWIGFIDGDDRIEDDMYERLLYNALAYHADISHCGFQIVANHGERVHYFYNTGKIIEQNRTDGIKDLLSGIFIEPSLCNKLFHRSLFDNVLQNEMINEDYRFNEDLLLNYLLFKEADKAIYEDFCPYHYMSRAASASRSSINIHRFSDPLSIQKYIMEDSEGEIRQEAYKRYLLTCINTCRHLYNRPEYGDIYDQAKDVLNHYDFRSELLNKRVAFKLRLFLISPGLYNWLYKIYEDFFQKKKYE